jgi:hypothetical protein
MKRTISKDRILECYDEFGENISVISYNRHNMEKVMSQRNLNIFEAFREVTLRSTKDTLCLITLNLPEDVLKFKEAKEFELTIDDVYFGQKIPRNVKNRIEEKNLVEETISVETEE